MYEDFYTLHEEPFKVAPDPRFFYRSQSHGNALDLIQHGLERGGGIVQLTGAPGAGKSTLCRVVLNELEGHVLTSLVLDPRVSGDELMLGILRDFGVLSADEFKRWAASGHAGHDAVRALNDFLLSFPSRRTPAVVIVDEAQKSSGEVLDYLHRLTSLAAGRRPLIQLVLIGQLGLDQLLRGSADRLDDRIAIRYRLRALTPFETAAYVVRRIAIASRDAESASGLFTAKARRAIHRATGGNPRLINLLCDRALLEGVSRRALLVDADIVRSAVDALGLGSTTALSATAANVLGWMRRRVAAL